MQIIKAGIDAKIVLQVHDEMLLEADVSEKEEVKQITFEDLAIEFLNLKSKLNSYDGAIYTIDARKISMETLGKYFPNTPMLAAIVKISGVMTDEELLKDMQSSFKHKFAKKPEVIDGNMKALEMALKEVTKV